MEDFMKKFFLPVMACLFLVSCASTSGHESSGTEPSGKSANVASGLSKTGGKVDTLSNETVYTNKTFNFGFKLPPTAVVMTGDSLDFMQTEPNVLVDIMAMDGNNVHSISITDVSESTFSDDEDDDDSNFSFANSEFFVEIMKDIFVASWEGAGFVTKDVGVKQMNFMGEKIPGVYYNGTLAGTDVWYYVVFQQSGNYIAQIVLGGASEASVKSMLGMYYRLK